MKKWNGTMKKMARGMALPALLCAAFACAGCAGGANAAGGAAGPTGSVSAAAARTTADTDAAREIELSVSTLRESEFLNLAARKYEEAHENVKVNVVSYEDERGDITKYMQIINTALMSGEGEDIIDASRLDWNRMAEIGKLTDLNEYLTIPPEEYYRTIMDAYLTDGKRYVAPLNFSFETYTWDAAYAGKEEPNDITLANLQSLAQKYPDTKLFSGASYGMDFYILWEQLFTRDYHYYIDLANKKANFENEKFIALLENVRAFGGQLAVESANEDRLFWEYAVYTPAMCNNGAMDYSQMFLLTNETGAGLFSTISVLPALNANSPNQAQAADFIQFLLSYEMQTSPELLFAAVHRQALTDAARRMDASQREQGFVPEGFDIEKNITAFNALADRLALWEYRDANISEFLYTEVSGYFDGRQTAEQTAQNLQNKINTYLQE